MQQRRFGPMACSSRRAWRESNATSTISLARAQTELIAGLGADVLKRARCPVAPVGQLLDAFECRPLLQWSTIVSLYEARTCPTRSSTS